MRKHLLVWIVLSALALSSLGAAGQTEAQAANQHPFQQSPLQQRGTIRGYVFLDSNQNGLFDEDEHGMENVYVTVSYGDYHQTYYSGDGDPSPEASPTLPDPAPGPGSYGPTPLQPGYWTVTLHVPDGYRSTTPSELVVMVPEGGATTGVNFGIYGSGEISYASGTGVAMGGGAGAAILPVTGQRSQPAQGPSLALLVALVGFLVLLGTPWCIARNPLK